MIGRRALLEAALLASLAAAAPARAMDRLPLGGRLRLAVPWDVRALDLFDPRSAAAALVGHAIADPLYATDALGRPYPVLAKALPEPAGADVLITLRAGLRTAANRQLGPEDVIYSLSRAARAADGRALTLRERVVVEPGRPDTVRIVGADAAAVTERLTLDPMRIISRKSGALPDATGAFAVAASATGLRLTRNLRAARGPAMLEWVELASVPDLASALRAFEVGTSDIGWLGAGLHRGRPGVAELRGPTFGVLLLRTGRRAERWHAPGVAQQLADRVAADQLAPLGVERVAGEPGAAWDGPPSELLVDGGEPQLAELARRVAGTLPADPGRLTVRPVTRRELAARRADGDFALLVDWARTLGPSDAHARAALARAAGVEPPGLAAVDADRRRITRAVSVGWLGDLALRGAASTAFDGLGAWDLGGVTRP